MIIQVENKLRIERKTSLALAEKEVSFSCVMEEAQKRNTDAME
ncbi:hypothetical protein Wcon_01722 [Wolbachia endosymbiont of Cylisticus convexus]|nr:hypothetical protein [Wolbachia endosymbiont of Cylisticus convexus]RDD33885.1 hypothetical protein Wcon_02086 [Wolbachia endosymbiont of Cylisticus convexus]RDD33910.1 hypothetical protein Wcon_02053 [Wolbachia endosymbiont of Cylisticus convexus]RDD33995.1 hypothetical protein Wcon_01970 [Wolbachia endosymbiont of Cylisticus convexus]RDD34153.1 hypothetical protein Wcon_01785 [Wolbachia endosymbiont of Cylisticus convexus]RDD34214.1 hypothetical protein Wcon_01722 [Wolbachia endosymbiont 